MIPETRYAKSGDLYIAYQVVGNGPLDLVWAPGIYSHIEHSWEEPSLARFWQRLASFSRLIVFDKRGTGMSDRVAGIPSLEERMDDIRAVMDAAGVERAALAGVSEGGPMSILFAATYPQRTSALILYGSSAAFTRSADYPWRRTREDQKQFIESISTEISTTWGRADSPQFRWLAPSMLHDERFMRWLAAYQRLGASPGAYLALQRMNVEIDVRHVLPTVRVPTLVMARTGDRTYVPEGRYIAAHIPGAKFVELAGNDHLHFLGDADAVVNEIEEFLTGMRPAPEPDRVLATVLFTDIVRSTEHAAQLGDRQWSDLLQSHYHLVRRELQRYRGREVDTTGDGFLATFDGPARAIRCALAARDAVRSLGIEIRAGLHTGEIELVGDNVGGIAVHIGARVAALAGANEVLVSSTVKDLVAGSGISFTARGAHTLKGVPGDWTLYAVAQDVPRL